MASASLSSEDSIDKFLPPSLPHFVISVWGRSGAGKSTFVNSVLHKRLCESGFAETTKTVTAFVHADFVSTFTLLPANVEQKILTATAAQCDSGHPFSIIDVPGVSSAQEISVLTKNNQILLHSDIALWVSDVATAFTTDIEAEQFLAFIKQVQLHQLTSGKLIQIGVVFTKTNFNLSSSARECSLTETFPPSFSPSSCDSRDSRNSRDSSNSDSEHESADTEPVVTTSNGLIASVSIVHSADGEIINTEEPTSVKNNYLDACAKVDKIVKQSENSLAIFKFAFNSFGRIINSDHTSTAFQSFIYSIHAGATIHPHNTRFSLEWFAEELVEKTNRALCESILHEEGTSPVISLARFQNEQRILRVTKKLDQIQAPSVCLEKLFMHWIDKPLPVKNRLNTALSLIRQPCVLTSEEAPLATDIFQNLEGLPLVATKYFRIIASDKIDELESLFLDKKTENLEHLKILLYKLYVLLGGETYHPTYLRCMMHCLKIVGQITSGQTTVFPASATSEKILPIWNLCLPKVLLDSYFTTPLSWGDCCDFEWVRRLRDVRTMIWGEEETFNLDASVQIKFIRAEPLGKFPYLLTRALDFKSVTN